METNLKFLKKLQGKLLEKRSIDTLQIQLGKICNITCTHCHVDAGPHRTEELNTGALEDILEIIERFDQIQTVDLTGWAPEMNNGFKEIALAARKKWKRVIVRSNLVVLLEDGYTDYPEFFREHGLEVTASLPCYTQDNVDSMRGDWVFEGSITALQKLNELWYGKQDNLVLNLVYNTQIPNTVDEFSLAPNQMKLQDDYKKFLRKNFGIEFHNLFAFANIPCGRFKKYLKVKNLYDPYIDFLADNYNHSTLDSLMCRTFLSVDYNGNIYDCDFNQVESVPAIGKDGKTLTLKDILNAGSLDVIKNIMVRDYCFGCTAWAGTSCGGAIT